MTLILLMNLRRKATAILKDFRQKNVKRRRKRQKRLRSLLKRSVSEKKRKKGKTERRASIRILK